MNGQGERERGENVIRRVRFGPTMDYEENVWECREEAEGIGSEGEGRKRPCEEESVEAREVLKFSGMATRGRWQPLTPGLLTSVG